MSEQNKDFVRRWFEEIWNKGRASAVDEMLAANGVIHGLQGAMRGPGAFKSFHTAYREAFPDVTIQIDDMVAEGDVVAVRWSGTATHNGNSLGFAATRKRIQFTGMGFARIVDGKLVEAWNNFDQLGMFQQLGVVNLPQAG
jgi:steroid delta-isomerase-like uncharacterized protein